MITIPELVRKYSQPGPRYTLLHRHCERLGGHEASVEIDPELGAAPARAVALDELTATLLPDPVRRALVAGGYQRVVVLPWGPIGSLPLSALRLGPGALVDRASVVVVPDLEALTLPLQRLPGPSDAERLLQEMYTFDAAMLQSGPRVVVGDPAFPQGGAWSFPPLPGARREAVAVAARLGTTALVGEAATHQAVSTALDRAVDRPGILYFATHGVSDGVNPMTESFLALADEPLLADEIRRRRHFGRHPLVVLSACQTGLGKVFDGGLFGISRAFYGAGAGQVVGSLWSVDDEATYRLMTTFVERLKEGATAPEEALRQAMIEARTANPDPATWASFVVFGNPSG